MTAHARLSPSASARWLSCPASVKLTEGMPNTSSQFAHIGTLCHLMAELCLTRGMTVADFPEDGEFAELGSHERRWVEQYVDYVRELGCEIHVEQKMKLNDDVWGTSDVVGFGWENY